MVKLVTKEGWEFWGAASVIIGGKEYDLDEMNEEQKRFMSGKIKENLLNGAYRGKATFKAEGLPPVEEVFPEAFQRA